MKRYRKFIFHFSCIPLLVLCTGRKTSSTSNDSKLQCTLDRLDEQPQTRFPLAGTYYLPRASEACKNASWRVIASPETSKNELFTDADGQTRFTPDALGEYVFQLGNFPDQQSILKVIDASEAPFQNYNYYPSASITSIGSEIWTADVLTPTVTRLDSKTLNPAGKISVGSWPVALAAVPGSNTVLVVQRGSDTIGFIDSSTHALVDALFVGDEPSNLVISEDGKNAYVTLATENAVAVVDIANKRVTSKIPTITDPLGLTIKGNRLFVASHRSGQTQPSTTPRASRVQNDIEEIDLLSTQSLRIFQNLGATIGSLLLSPDGDTLYVSQVRNDPTVPLGALSSRSFVYEVTGLDTKTGTNKGSIDLSPKAANASPLVGLNGMTFASGLLWVVSEGNDATVGIDPSTFTEVKRVLTSGRPRGIAVLNNSLFVHGHQGTVVTKIDLETTATLQGKTSFDPRPDDVSQGQRYFTGAGKTYGRTWSCNSCHVDGLTDTLIWNAGPVKDTHVSRPFFWLEGTYSLGWQGYLSSIKNYAYTVSSNIGVVPTTDEALGLSAYLASLMPPPAGNSWTRKDGSLSTEAKRGKEIYEGKANCSSCHGLPLTANRTVISASVSEDKTDIPALVGVYRNAVWFKHGEARNFEDAIKLMVDFTGAELLDSELSDLTRYVRELTARDFFLLASNPRDPLAMAQDLDVEAEQPLPQPVGIDVVPELIFSLPVFKDEKNLSLITLEDAGNIVPSHLEVLGRKVFVKPNKVLDFGKTYTIRIPAAFESFDERRSRKDSTVQFRTGPKPVVRLDGEYKLTISIPKLVFGGPTPVFDPKQLVQSEVSFKATSDFSGAKLVFSLTPSLLFSTQAVVSGSKLYIPPSPVPVGPAAFADGFSGFVADVLDTDSDGIGDSSQGVYTFSGPGFRFDSLPWTLSRKK